MLLPVTVKKVVYSGHVSTWGSDALLSAVVELCLLTEISHTLLSVSINPLTSVSHCSGFKVKLTFQRIQFFGSSLYIRQILGILCLQIDCS